MRRQRPSRLHLLFIVPLTLLVCSARLAWTQETPSANKTPSQFASLAAQFAAVPEAKICFHPAYDNLTLPFVPKQPQDRSWLKFPPLDISYHSSLSKTTELLKLWQLATIGGLQDNASHFLGNAPVQWFTNDSLQHTGHYPVPDQNDAMRFYGHRIPFAGPIILGIDKQAKFHPRVTRVVELIRPGVSMGKRRMPGK